MHEKCCYLTQVLDHSCMNSVRHRTKGRCKKCSTFFSFFTHIPLLLFLSFLTYAEFPATYRHVVYRVTIIFLRYSLWSICLKIFIYLKKTFFLPRVWQINHTRLRWRRTYRLEIHFPNLEINRGETGFERESNMESKSQEWAYHRYRWEISMLLFLDKPANSADRRV